jgi:spermidine synthase
MSVFSGIKLPKTLYKTHSDISGDIEVVEIGNTRSLKVSGITQSINPDSPYVPRMVWGRAVKLLLQEEPEMRNILMLGLGGGTMQHLIAHNFPGVQIVSVEFDSEIVETAQHYFGIDQIPNHKIITADACRIIVEPHYYDLDFGSFDVVLVDIYVGSEYPELGRSGNFLAHICKMAGPAGLVVINRIYLEDHQEEVNEFVDFAEDFLHDVKSIIIPGKTNSDNILIYGKV